MTSFGENTLSVNSRIIGQVRVLDLYPGSALYPRLTIRLGITLHELPEEQFAKNRPIRNFEVRDLHGELRLDESTTALGLLHWAGPRRYVRSAPYISENQIDVVCDLDWHRLERIEERRAGGEAVIWVALWPSLTDAIAFLDCDIHPIRATIPRDRWLNLLAAFTGSRRTLLEVVHPAADAAEFQAALGHLQDADSRLARGDYDEALAACRRAIESVCTALSVPNEAEAIAAALEPRTDAKRARAYSGIVAQMKALGNLTVHRSEATALYTRAEAQFAIGVTQHVVGLLAALVRPGT
jgi:hypothetical protein